MATSRISPASMVLRIALAVFLIVTGIMTLQLDSGLLGKIQAGFSGNELAIAVRSFLKGDTANVVIVLLGILELVSGLFLVAGFFMDTGAFNKLALFVIMALWIVVIVLVDVVGKGGILGDAFKTMGSLLAFLKVLSAHLLVLGAIMTAQE